MKQLLKSFFYLFPAFLSEKNALIFINYIKLFITSFIYHRFKKRGTEQEKQTGIMGYKISFFNYPALINQFEEIFIYKSYRFNSRSQNPFIFDCGSNIGISLLYFKIFHPGSRIMAFEPDPVNFRLLKKNIEQNRFSNITLHHFALGTQEGSCKLYHSQEGSGSLNTSIYANEPDSGFINAPMKKLSSFIHEEVDFMKMDVEGAEGEIIREVSISGKLENFRELTMEYHPIPGRNEKIITELKDAGFILQNELKFNQGPEMVLQFKKHH